MPVVENPLSKASFRHQRSLARGISSILSRRLPRSGRRLLRRLLVLPLDLADLVMGRRKNLVPPRYLNYAGDGDFEKVGDEFLKYFVELGELKPSDCVLEMGSGIGRMARPLTRYLTTGEYYGVEIVPEGVSWCQREITPRFSNFRFQPAEVYSAMYNPRGKYNAAEYRFPFDDGQFDFIFLTSVFTHMFKREMDNYLSEIARTIGPHGKCLISLFLLNSESRKLIGDGKSSLKFEFFRNGSYIEDERNPDRAVAFDEESVWEQYYRVGMTPEIVRYGGWCGRSDYLSYQDIVIARRDGPRKTICR
jgi:SAM-dependent methyltransferase